jgi:hypothetical protein
MPYAGDSGRLLYIPVYGKLRMAKLKSPVCHTIELLVFKCEAEFQVHRGI